MSGFLDPIERLDDPCRPTKEEIELEELLSNLEIYDEGGYVGIDLNVKDKITMLFSSLVDRLEQLLQQECSRCRKRAEQAERNELIDILST